MRIRITLLITVLGLILVGSAAAGERTTYRCAADYANYTGCAVIKNEVKSWTGPGLVEKSRPLVFAAFQNPGIYWEAQTSIAGGQTGNAIVGGPFWAAGAFLYSMRPTDGKQNYQAVVGLRLDDDDTREGCIESTYLDCTMGSQLETGRDSKHVFTITSRPFEVRIINSMPVAMQRVDGPYWTNALPAPVSDNAARIGTRNTGTVGSLRSVSRTAAYAAVYRFQRSETDPRFNGSSVLISVKTPAIGDSSGSCTPVYPPSGTRFACDLSWSGLNPGHRTALLRVYVP